MILRFANRAAAPEWMDQEVHDPEELLEALRHLRRLNRIFGAARPVIFGLHRLWSIAGKPKKLTVLDVGSGSGEINRSLLGWAERLNVDIRLILTDVTEEAQIEAERLFRDDHRVVFERRDLFEVPARYADFVTASQFAHHFASDRLPGVVRRMAEAARFGVVISDIHRHWAAWTAVWIATRLVSRNRYIRHDGPLSVAKGFQSSDWADLREALGLSQLDVHWRPLFRWVLTISREDALGG